jgi:hypothetical protein
VNNEHRMSRLGLCCLLAFVLSAAPPLRGQDALETPAKVKREKKQKKNPRKEKKKEKKAAKAEEPAVKAVKPYEGPFRHVGFIAHARVLESSGIAASRRHANVLWTHNDKGNDPVLYAIAPDGRPLAEFAVAASADDWEDVAVDGNGKLYLANIGNNKAKRSSLEVHRFPEPDPAAAAAGIAPPVLRPEASWRLYFPGRPFDCESLVVHGSHGYVISKMFDGTPATLYRFPLDGPRDVRLERVAEMPIGAPVTAADLSADGKRLAVLSWAGIYVFEVNGDLAKLPTPAAPIPVPALKLEGLCFTDDGGMVMTAESRHVYRMGPK